MNYWKERRLFMKKRFKEINDWKGIILMFVIFIGILAFVSFTSAAPPFQTSEHGYDITFPKVDVIPQNKAYNITIHVFNNSDGKPILSELTCTLQLSNNSGNLLEKNFTYAGHNEYFYYLSSGNFSTIETKTYTIYCYGNFGGFSEGILIVTPTGFTGTLGFYILLLILSLGIIILGYYVEDAWVIVLGSFGLVLFGLFILLYGINGFKDSVYTYGFAIITMMLGAYFGIKGALENVN